MCGRYVSPDEAAIEREWKLTHIGDQIKAPNWNVSPTNQVPAIRRIEEGAAVDNAAPNTTRSDSTCKLGKVVQTIGATSQCS